MTRTMILGLFVVATVGCQQHGHGTKPAGSGKAIAKDDHHEHGAGPHGGTVFDLGKYHAEFKVDHKTQEATIYILGNDEKTPSPIDAAKLDLTIKTPAFSVELKPVPLDGEKDGKSSRFVGKHENFGKEQEFEGTAVIVVGGKPMEGKFKEEEEKKK